MSEYHVPVLLEECLAALDIKKGGAYVDVTFGGGGHSREILSRLGENGRLFAFDQDPDAQQNKIDDARFVLIGENFRFISRFLRFYGVRKVDGVLADLDMRMNQQADKTAIDIINNYSAIELQRVFGQYGEVRNSKTLAERIVQERQRYTIKTSTQFLNIIGSLIRGQRNRYLAQVFQALRIEVNDEINSIRTFLEESAEVLPVGGKLVIISYHSLEDRVVKNFLKFGNFEGKPEKDFYGNILKPFKMITRKPIIPTPEEVKINPKSRSAKLRIAEKL